MTFLTRGSGVLLHLTSLPGPCGIGDLGPAAHAFVDRLAAAGQQYWQFLPLCPTSRGLDNSPYMGLSAFAGNALLISPQLLVDQGLLDGQRLAAAPAFSEYLVDYDAVRAWKEELLATALAAFRRRDGRHQLEEFVAAQQDWLPDHALFMALREENRGLPWQRWPAEVARRQPAALATARKRLAERIEFYQFGQMLFFRQWRELRRHARRRGVRLVGDIPIYVALDSAEVWARPELFLLDEQTLQPTHVAGVPPDYFSATGQRWGNPLFRWDGPGDIPRRLDRWWAQRFRLQFELADIVRVDHFRGFEACWQIPAAEADAVRGQWVKGPGPGFFQRLTKELLKKPSPAKPTAAASAARSSQKAGPLPIIAEDLGVITPEVEALRDGLGLPGMKILQFAFDSDAANSYLPHNYPHRNCVVYTGTHDNDTAVGWYLSDRCSPEARQRLLRCAGGEDGGPVHWYLIRLALASVADLAIIPLQDILGFGGDCRMNIPGTARGNWRWRVAPRFLEDDESFARLRDETEFYNRLPASHAGKTAK